MVVNDVTCVGEYFLDTDLRVFSEHAKRYRKTWAKSISNRTVYTAEVKLCMIVCKTCETLSVHHKIIYMYVHNVCVRMNIVSVLLRVRLLVCIIIKYICP